MTSPDTDAEPSAGVDRRTTRLVLAFAILAALSVLAFGTWWFNRPPTLLGDRTAGGMAFAPHPVASAAMAAGITYPDVKGHDHETIRFTSATAHTSVNTAHSTMTLSICRRRAGQEPLGGGSVKDLARYCSRVSPIKDGTVLHWTNGYPPREFVLLVMTPTTPGTTRVDRVLYKYSRDWRHGHAHGEDAGHLDVSIRATE